MAVSADKLPPDILSDGSEPSLPIILLAAQTQRQWRNPMAAWVAPLTTVNWTKDDQVLQSEKPETKQTQVQQWDIRAVWRRISGQLRQQKTEEGSLNTLGASPIVPASSEADTFRHTLLISSPDDTISTITTSSDILEEAESKPSPPPLKRSRTPPPPGLSKPRDRPFLRREHSRWRGNGTLRSELCMRMAEERWPGLHEVLFYADSRPAPPPEQPIYHTERPIGWKEHVEAEGNESGDNSEKTSSTHIEFSNHEEDFSSDSDGSI